MILDDRSEEYEGCRALLLDIIKRAAHDWVLYRRSGNLNERLVARDAFIWLFREEPGHWAWNQRVASGTECWSFLSVCESLGIDPDVVRIRVRTLTPRDIQHVGRPPVRRRTEEEKTRRRHRR